MISRKIALWENEKYLGEAEDGFRPIMDTYILDGKKKRGAVLICPGGAYVNVSPREAEPIAMQFNAAGLHAFVLKYSVAPRRHPQPILDASRAMCILREKADEWNIYPDRIAVCGFSAGGHLAASLGVHWNKPYIQNTPGIKPGMNRPNALILCYPVITTGEFVEMYSFNQLLGEDANKELLHEMSVECHVNEQTPPAFIWHTCNDDDTKVENSMLFAEAMRRKNIPFELHIYQEGPHGLSLATAETDDENMGVYPHVATWFKLCTEWLELVFPRD